MTVRIAKGALEESLVLLGTLVYVKGTQDILVQRPLIPALGNLHPLIGLLLSQRSLANQLRAALLNSSNFNPAQLIARNALLLRHCADRPGKAFSIVCLHIDCL